MADQAQLNLLKQGVAAWNEWRRQNPHVQPGLNGAIMAEADLKEADLRRANLSRADLSGADLHRSHALLSEAALNDTVLYQADLNVRHI